MPKAFVGAAAALLFLFSGSGCASIIHGETQEVSFASTPSNAVIEINGAERGRTPLVLELDRGDKHVVMLKLDGYEPYQMRFDQKIDGWFWGNIVFGGLIGIVIDSSTGAMYKLTPDAVSADLGAETVASADGGRLHIAVVLTPQEGLEQIGQLVPAP